MAKRWTGPVVFAPAQSEGVRLAITTLKAWRLKEPVSGRVTNEGFIQSSDGCFCSPQCRNVGPGRAKNLHA